MSNNCNMSRLYSGQKCLNKNAGGKVKKPKVIISYSSFLKEPS